MWHCWVLLLHGSSAVCWTWVTKKRSREIAQVGKREKPASLVSRDRGKRTSHRNRDDWWVTRAAEHGSQQDLGMADSQHPTILPCSIPHLFSSEIPQTAFKILQPIQNWHQISWAFCKPVAAGQESVITPASRLPADAACTRGKEGIPALATHTFRLDAL